MEIISDKTQCKRLLRTREAGGHKFESFFRANLGSYLLFFYLFYIWFDVSGTYMLIGCILVCRAFISHDCFP